MDLFFSLSRIIILFQWNNGCCLFYRCGYSTTNHAMCYPFVPIIIVFLRSLLNYSIIAILLSVVLYHRLWLIIQGIVLSTTLPIIIWSFFPETVFYLELLYWPMGDTRQLIGDLVPIILTGSSSKDDCLPCPSIFLEVLNELCHFFWQTVPITCINIYKNFDGLFHGFDKIFHAPLLLLFKFDILILFLENYKVKKNRIST